jgi:hypothetical protein
MIQRAAQYLIGIIAFSALLTLSFQGCSGSGSEVQGTSVSPDQGGYNLDELNTYGDWVQLDNYGRAWRPFVVDGWMPFDNGHWSYANASWTWISYEPFGWIVYHYGYWYDDPFYGWVWIPSNDPWSPARVVWVDYDDYVGWAPMGPRGVAYGRPWEAGQARYWHVVRQKDFTEDNIGSYRVNEPVRTSGATRAVIDRAPDKATIDRYVGRPVHAVTVQHEAVRLPGREVKKMTLPPGERKRVEQNSPRVKKEVLVPRQEFQRKHSKPAPKGKTGKK